MFTHDERLGKDENINCTGCGSETAQFFDREVSLCAGCYDDKPTQYKLDDETYVVEYEDEKKLTVKSFATQREADAFAEKLLQDSCAHEETEVGEALTGLADLNGDEDVMAVDVCIKCDKILGAHEPWTPDTLEEADLA